MAELIGQTMGKIVTLLGWDGTAFRPIAVDVDGKLKVLTDPGLDDIITTMIQGFSDLYGLAKYRQLQRVYAPYSEVVSASASSGQLSVTGTPCPAGFYRIITGMMNILTSGSADNLNLNFVHAGGNRVVKRLIPAATNIPLDWQGLIVMEEGDYARSIANNVTSGTTTNLQVFGYDIEIA